MEQIQEIYQQFSAILPSWIQGILGLFFTLYIKNTAFRKHVNKILSRFMKTVSGREILAHEIFYHEKLFCAYTDRFIFKNKTKTEIFKDMLISIIKSSIHVTRTMIKAKMKELKSMHRAELLAFILFIINSIVEDYEKNIKLIFRRKYGIYGKDVYKLVYDSQKGLKTLHDVKMDEIRNDIETLGAMSGKHKEIIRIFLYQLMFSVQKALFESISIFEEFNGELDSLIAKIEEQGEIG